MPKIQHVYFEVMPDGKVMEGVPVSAFECAGCFFYRKRGNGKCLKKILDYKCFDDKNPLKDYIIYKDTGKRVMK